MTLLPITLTFRDFNGVEKIAQLPRALTMDGVPEGDDPEIGDIGYYEPSGDPVLYYGDVAYFPGIVWLGKLDSGWDALEQQASDFERSPSSERAERTQGSAAAVSGDHCAV